MNHTRFTKEDYLPDWVRRDNKVKKGDRVELFITYVLVAKVRLGPEFFWM